MNIQAQTFFVNSQSVAGAVKCQLSAIDLYFKGKPTGSRTSSGLIDSYVELVILEATSDGISINKPLGRGVRKTASQVSISNDASIATKFEFVNPIEVETDKFYAFMINTYDSAYQLWESVTGDRFVGTNDRSSGVSGRNVGSLFTVGGDSFQRQAEKSLKFDVYVSRYSSNSSVSSTLIADNYEFLTTKDSFGRFFLGESVFQDVANLELPIPVFADLPGNLQINSLSSKILGSGTLFTNLSPGQYIVLEDTLNRGEFSVNEIESIQNNTLLTLKSNPSITTTGFSGKYRSAAVADMYEPTPYNGLTNEIILFKSQANNTHRFVSGGLRGVTVSNTGAGYSNSNVIRVVSNGEDAIFSISTNNTGSIVSLNVINPGEQINVASPVRIEASISSNTLVSGNPGANAVVQILPQNIGPILTGAMSGAKTTIVSVDNKVINEFVPQINETTSVDGSISVRHLFSSGNTIGLSNSLYKDTKLSVLNKNDDYLAFIASRSNEIASGNVLSAKLDLSFRTTKTGNLFDVPSVRTAGAALIAYENDINNDATNEHTNSGNARSKSISRRIGFAQGAISEDLVVYVRAFRPFGTDFKVYGKFHNSIDDEPFDDKLWTELKLVSGNTFTDSAAVSPATYEFTIPQYPESELTLAGVVSTSNNSSNIIGSGTSFSNDLVGRLVKIYSPINQENYQVAGVASVTNTTHMVLTSPVVNNSIQESVVGNGLKIDLLKFNTAYNNILNDNVVRYHTLSNLSPIDGFDTFAVKIVLLSENKYIVPEIDDISMLGVSS